MKRFLKTSKLLTVGFFSLALMLGAAANIEAHTINKKGAKATAKNEPYLELKSGKLNMHDRYGVDFIVSRDAYDRLAFKVDCATGRRIILVKSGKEANMSEELYRQLIEWVDQNNKALDYYRGLAAGSIRPKTNK